MLLECTSCPAGLGTARFSARLRNVTLLGFHHRRGGEPSGRRSYPVPEWKFLMRRLLLVSMIASLLLTAGAGCSKAKKTRRTTSSSSSSKFKKPVSSRPLPTLGGSPTGGTTSLRNVKGPKTMGGLMVDTWKADLTNPSADKRILAAKELGSMGPSAKSALPALQKMASDRNSQVAAAAKAAISKINR